MLFKSGESPPCMQKIFSSMMAATGKQLKQSVNVFHILMLYRRLPAPMKTRTVSKLVAKNEKVNANAQEVVLLCTHIHRKNRKYD
jgi:hypothetical protein